MNGLQSNCAELAFIYDNELIDISVVPDPTTISISSLGEELNNQECQVLAHAMNVRRLTHGELLVSEGDETSALFLLTKGGLAVSSLIENHEINVYEMRQGECAGTRAFIDREPRKVTLRAIGDTVVYSIEPETFLALLETQPRIVHKVMCALYRITHSNLMQKNQESQQLSNYISKTNGRY